jgi:hypothetical protein
MPSSSIQRIVTDIMTNYDHNKNGSIELERIKPTGNMLQKAAQRAKNPDERVRSSTSSYSIGDELTVNSSVRTQHQLFVAADANGDKKVTRQELVKFISENYDSNKNGELESRGAKVWKPAEELQKFEKDFGERLESYNSFTI